MRPYIVLIFCFFLITASCKKNNTPTDEDQLPPATQTGANTFGCLINGKVWLPKGYSNTGTPNPKISFEILPAKYILLLQQNIMKMEMQKDM
ncbi:MAG: hypothetical protein ABIR81_06155 [Ginsengibacter sp.]